MKPGPECLRCLITTRLKEVEKSSLSDTEKFIVSKMIAGKILELFNPDVELTKLATSIFKYSVSLAPSIIEYYRLVKKASNKKALESLSLHREYAGKLDGYERFEYLVKLSAIANLIDYGVADHNPVENTLTPKTIIEYPVVVNDISKLYSVLSRGGKTIAWLFDNSGEVVYDTLLVSEIKSLGNKVYGLVKEEPGFQNDVTISDALELQLDKLLDKLVVYSSTSSIHIEALNNRVKEVLGEVDLIIAKGMSHYEYLSEVDLGKPVCFILIPKCDVVARAIKEGSKGKIVVLCRGV